MLMLLAFRNSFLKAKEQFIAAFALFERDGRMLPLALSAANFNSVGTSDP
jgi:hypothetical protein